MLFFKHWLKGSLVPPPSGNTGNYRNCWLAPPLCPQNHPCTFLTLSSIPACPAGSVRSICKRRLPAKFSHWEALPRGWLEGRREETEYHSSFLSPPAASLTAAASPPVAWCLAGWSSPSGNSRPWILVALPSPISQGHCLSVSELLTFRGQVVLRYVGCPARQEMFSSIPGPLSPRCTSSSHPAMTIEMSPKIAKRLPVGERDGRVPGWAPQTQANGSHAPWG